MVLDGLEECCISAVPKRKYKKVDGKYSVTASSVHVVRYADDFIVTAKRREDIKDSILPAIEEFLRERGLSLK
jgi:RNA-directed DNA polymerase